MLKKVLFTDSDMDGCGCKIVFELAHQCWKEGVDFTVISLLHGNIDNDVMDYIHNGYMTNSIDDQTIICFSDLCPSRECLLEIQKFGNPIRIWDHHQSAMYALEVVPEGATIITENSMGVPQSGTSIIYQHFCNVGFNDRNDIGKFFVNMTSAQSELVGNLIDSIRAYDTFEFKQTGAIAPKQLNTLFFMLGFDNFYTRYMGRILNMKSTDLIDPQDMMFVKARMDNEQAIIDKFIADTSNPDKAPMIFPVGIRGLHVAFTYGARGASISELGYQWLSKHPEFDAIASIGLGEKITFMFRSVKDGVNVSETLAIPLGGGGHPKAAGAVASKEFSDNLLYLIMKEISKTDPIFYDLQNDNTPRE